MFHAINAWLARLARRISDSRPTRDNQIVAANGWQVQRLTATGTIRYRDPRFSQLATMRRCPRCGGSGQAYYQARDGEYVLAACDTCGNGRVGSKGTGMVTATGRG